MKIYGRIEIVPPVSSHMLLRLKPSFREGNKNELHCILYLTFSGNQNRKSNYIFFIQNSTKCNVSSFTLLFTKSFLKKDF